MSIEDAWDELDSFLTGEDVLPAPSGETDVLTLAGQIDANRAGRALARLQRDEDEIIAVVDAERERLAAFEADRRAGIDRQRTRLVEALEAFARMERARRGVSTVKLPSITLGLKKDPNRIEAADPEVTEFVRVKPPVYEFDKVAAKAALTPGPVSVEKCPHGCGPLDGADDSWICPKCGDEWPLTTPDGFERHVAVDADGKAHDGITFLVPREPTFRWELRAETEADPESPQFVEKNGRGEEIGR